MSTFADRLKIARGNNGADIIPSRQFVLNCGTKIAGSCHGGSATGLFEFIKSVGYIPYESCLSYEACSAESEEGTCPHGDYTCKPINICRTCDTYKKSGGACREIEMFPNATVAEYGKVEGEEDMMKGIAPPFKVYAPSRKRFSFRAPLRYVSKMPCRPKIYARGPIACPIDATPLEEECKPSLTPLTPAIVCGAQCMRVYAHTGFMVCTVEHAIIITRCVSVQLMQMPAALSRKTRPRTRTTLWRLLAGVLRTA
eukprot:4301746-Pyramimonas_sp.AAC.1